MYNNLPQQTPYMYGYPQRMMPAQTNEAPAVAPMQQYSAPIMMPQMNYIKGRPVVSIDEARASQIDLDGSLYVFPDLGNKKIYTKQINLDGTASFNVFELTGAKEEAPAPIYVTKTELDEILASFKASLISDQTRQPESAPVVKQQFNKTFNL